MKVQVRPRGRKNKPARVGLFEVPLMDAIEKRGNDAFGAQLGDDMSERLGYYVPHAQVYSTIKRMVRRGLARHRKNRVVAGSPPLKVYELTAEGKRALAEAARQYSAVFGTERTKDADRHKEKQH